MRKASVFIACIAAISFTASAHSQDQSPQNPQIDYDRFVKLAVELKETRNAHQLPLKQFSAESQTKGAILLDTRSAAAFNEGHIEGAINLPFSDFTDEKLAKVLGSDKSRAIYIYCNNNFSDNIRPVVSKRAPLALNIPTFINLHGYGYTNVWELADVVPTSAVNWIGTAAKKLDDS